MLYFIVQSVGSLSCFIGSVLIEQKGFLNKWVTFGLLLKIRLAPVHFWGGMVIAKLSGLKAYVFLV